MNVCDGNNNIPYNFYLQKHKLIYSLSKTKIYYEINK